MKIETKKLSDLTPAPYNPRKITPKAMKGLQASIKRFGMVEPIVWNSRTGNVVGGHQRLQVLLKEGVQETEVVVVDLPDKEEKALNVTLNNYHVAGDFTVDLHAILDDLPVIEFPDLCLDDLAFDFPTIEIKEKEVDENLATGHECPQCGYKW